MKSRLIRPDFFSDDKIAECGPMGLPLYLGLMCLSDRDGRLEDRPTKIKVQILPYFDVNVDEILDLLASAKLIVRYQVASAKLIEVIDFSKYQQVYAKEKSQGYPAPSEATPKLKQSLPQASAKLLNSNSNNINNNIITTKESSNTTKAKAKKKKKPQKTTEVPKLDPSVDTPPVREALETWLTYKKERKQGYQPTALRMLYKKIKDMGGAQFVRAVENSVQSNYMGLFTPSGSGGGGKESAAEKSQRILRENHARFAKMQDEEESTQAPFFGELL